MNALTGLLLFAVWVEAVFTAFVGQTWLARSVGSEWVVRWIIRQWDQQEETAELLARYRERKAAKLERAA